MKKLFMCTLLSVLFLSSCIKEKKETPINGDIAVESISLSNAELSMYVGNTMTLTYKIVPKNATDLTVKWESLNPDVVTINKKGEIKAIAPGNVNVMATSANGIYAICNITVKEATVFSNMIGHWKGHHVVWVKNATGEIITEEEAKTELFPAGQDDDWYERAINTTRNLYCFDLEEDSTIQLGLMCQDGDFRYIPGVLKEAEAFNTYDGKFDVGSTRYHALTYLYELSFKWTGEYVKMRLHEENADHDVITYYEIIKEN